MNKTPFGDYQRIIVAGRSRFAPTLWSEICIREVYKLIGVYFQALMGENAKGSGENIDKLIVSIEESFKVKLRLA